MCHVQCCGLVSYVCGRPVASRVWAPQRYRWCHTLAEMLRVLHNISSQMLAKLKQNQPWEICLHFHGLQKIISFNFSILLPLLYSCFTLTIHIFGFFYFFSFIMSGRGRGRSGGGNGRGRGHGHAASGMMKPMPNKPCKGRKLNERDTDDMKTWQNLIEKCRY